jgi:16S rRNA (cytidine1402-2'-O)-methyltransferase
VGAGRPRGPSPRDPHRRRAALAARFPCHVTDRVKEIQILEKRVTNQRQTQIFIETPYRNNHLISDLIKSCSPTTLLCIAANITGENEFIATKTIQQWKNKVPDLHKIPVIFLLGT